MVYYGDLCRDLAGRRLKLPNSMGKTKGWAAQAAPMPMAKRGFSSCHGRNVHLGPVSMTAWLKIGVYTYNIHT
jgi:hypothetical protein